MKVLGIQPLENTFTVECHSAEDLVFVSSLIHPNDFVSGETDRNIKPREPGQKAFRIKLFLTISVRSVEVDKSLPSLRVSGLIESGSPAEFVEIHAQHALVFTLYTPIRVRKSQLFAHQIDRLRAFESESKKPLYLGIVLDDEEASILHVTPSGLKEMGTISSQKSGKMYKTDSKEGVYFSKIAEVVWASPLSTIIVAGPGFTREGLVKYLQDSQPKGISKTFLSVPTSDTGLKGIREALSNASITKALGESRVARESSLVEDVLKHLGKETGLATYGLFPVERAVNAGAAHTLLVSSDFYSSHTEKIDSLLDLCKQMGVQYHLLEKNTDPGRQVSGLGGIVALLRYAFN